VLKLIDVGQSRNMGPPKHSQPPAKPPLAKADAWAIRLVLLLQGIALVTALLAGKSLEELSAISEMWIKILELVARAD